TVALICAIGLLNLYSATHGTQHAGKFDQQLVWVVVGGMGYIGVTRLDYRAGGRVAWIGLVAVIVLLVLVRLLGRAGLAQGWIRFSSVLRMQPSELAKLAVILVLARIMQPTDHAAYRWSRLALPGLALMVPVGLVAIQPDLGSAILLTLMILSVGYLCMPDV